VIKYLGSKRVLIPAILEVVKGLEGVESVLDLFSGTSRVGQAMKQAGYRVHANDHLAYAHVLAQCYVAVDRSAVLEEVQERLVELAATPPRRGWFTETFCERSWFFTPDNGARVDAMRDAIAEWDLAPLVRAVLLVSLMEAADRVDSTVGVQMAYLKNWAPRALKPLSLRVPAMVDGVGQATCLEAVDAAKSGRWDLAYLDPPYNQHSYLGNYHVWESLVRWDRPAVYGKACKRVDVRERKSDFNSKRRIHQALDAVLDALAGRVRYLVVSFSNEGFLGPGELVESLSRFGRVETQSREHRRYVGARIGIYNPGGKKVGRVKHTQNTEFLHVVTVGDGSS
jgi:adenine-specific DNA-methyltransferase